MNDDGSARIREYVEACLRGRGDEAELSDSESLFQAGRLDSLAMTELIQFLEQHYGVDFAKVTFDVELIDSVAEIAAFVAQRGSTPPRQAES